MTSNGVATRDQVLAELATLGSGHGDALTVLAQVRQVAVFADQVLGELARLAGVVDTTGAFAAAGYTSAAAFFRHGCGRSAGRSGELVAVGRALPRLPATCQALAQGRVSFDATHVICRAVAQISDDDLAAAAERQMLDAATIGLPGSRPAADALTRTGEPATGRGAEGDPAGAEPGPAGEEATPPERSGDWVPPGLDPRELRRLGEDLTYRADPDAVEERQRRRFERRYLSFGLTLDDVGMISGACGDALSLEIIKTAAEAFSAPGGGEDRRTAAQRRMDGLTAACQAALDSGRAGSRHGAMPHVSILLDEQSPTGGDPADGSAADGSPADGSPADGGVADGGPVGGSGLSGGSGPPRDSGRSGGPGPAGASSQDRSRTGLARTGHGTLLTAAQVLALACRAEISVIRWREGLPLNVGRRYRTETPALRRALTARDRGCRWPGCGMPAAWCTAHHIRHWKRGGGTRLGNMALFCFVHHHYFIHLLGWTLNGSPDGHLRISHPRGHLILDSPLPGQPASRSP